MSHIFLNNQSVQNNGNVYTSFKKKTPKYKQVFTLSEAIIPPESEVPSESEVLPESENPPKKCFREKCICQNQQNIQCSFINNYTPYRKKIPKWKNNTVKIQEPEPVDTMPPKERFRVICEENIPYIRNIDLPVIAKNNPLEAVLIEYRCFPHLEFLIRNAMIKLGDKWSHTIVCGNLNYDFMMAMCANISPEITVIKTDYDNLNQSTYSVLLASKSFWEMFSGEKILLYQEDSCIFKSNIDDFLQWDYIGAPFLKTQNDTPNCVGNGGLSLRTRQIMIDVIDRISMQDAIIGSSTIKYMRNNGMTVCPEDVYFSKNMQDYGIGRVADWDSALAFSSETVHNGDSFGGHNFWLSDEKWKERVYTQAISTFKLYYNYEKTEHRGGWNNVIESLSQIKFLNDYSPIVFLDMIEKYFLWESNEPLKQKWSGFVHCTPFTPPYLEIVNISKLFTNPVFIESLDNCHSIFTLSNYLTNYIEREFAKLKKNTKIYTLKHPSDTNNIVLFDIDRYEQNPSKKLLQIGQQLRKITSIYLLHDIVHEKIWLTGTKNMQKCYQLLKNECEYLNITINNEHVKMYYAETFEEYDNLLSENIVFVDFFDAAANNTIIECIARNTPIICKKLEGVVEYLGVDYPLYFEKLDQVKYLLTIENIEKAYIYLKNMDKREFEMDYFLKKVLNM